MSTVGTWTLPSASAASLSGAGALLAERELALGNDVFFDGDYGINAAGDWVTVTEEAALKQGMYHRLTTRPGEYRARPNYGVGIADYVKRRNNSSTIDQLRVAIVDQLSLEERIQEVVSVEVERLTDRLQVAITVVAGGRTVKSGLLSFGEKDLLSLKRTQR